MEELHRGWSPRRLAEAIDRDEWTVQRWCTRGLVPSERVKGGRGSGHGGRLLIPEAVALSLVNGEYVFPSLASEAA